MSPLQAVFPVPQAADGENRLVHRVDGLTVGVGRAGALFRGAAWGALNGFLVAVAKIPALIVTLGSLGMALGFSQILTGGLDVRAVPERLVTEIGAGTVLGVPALVVIAAIVTGVAAVVLPFPRFG